MITRKSALAATLVMAAALSVPQTSFAEDPSAEQVVGAIVGLSVASKLAKRIREAADQRKAEGRPYTLPGNVLCIPDKEICFKDGHISLLWTAKEFKR